ncbi:MAG: methyltransferase domain-containing protein [Nocardioides sp.]|nr:methyltransferase domain-containing protein [Nocardioides sp.]
MNEVPFSTVFALALRGEQTHVVRVGDEPVALPVGEWTQPADVNDHRMLDLCIGPTLDVGCGPGRMTAELAKRGHVVLGIDVVHEAVGQTRERGGAAMLRDVFDELPGEGRWESALLADGNVGIGGDPVALLHRLSKVIDPRGRVVVEVARPGVLASTHWAALQTGEQRSRPFKWSVVGVDSIEATAAEAGLAVASVERIGERWVAVLQGAV